MTKDKICMYNLKCIKGLLTIRQELLEHNLNNYKFNYIIGNITDTSFEPTTVNNKYDYTDYSTTDLGDGTFISEEISYLTKYPFTLSLIDNIILDNDEDIILSNIIDSNPYYLKIMYDVRELVKLGINPEEYLMAFFPDLLAFSKILSYVDFNLEDSVEDLLILKLAYEINTDINK